MSDDALVNTGQAAYWGGPVSDAWITDQERLDSMFAPVTARLIAAASIDDGDVVLDVGCGCGETSLLAAREAADVSVVGIDLSAEMLARARERAVEAGIVAARFVRADGQVARFDQRFDVVLSRFGVMFFDDPGAAFANLARLVALGGRLAFACWQDVLVNDWMVVPAATLIDHVGLESLDDEATRPFSLSDPDRVRSLLGGAGFVDVEVEPLVVDVLLGGPATVEETVEFVIRSGSGHLLLDGVEEPRRSRAVEALARVLAERHDGDGVPLRASVWIVTASVGGDA